MVGPKGPYYKSAPAVDDSFKVVTDKENGTYLVAENVSGEITLYMPNAEYIK